MANSSGWSHKPAGKFGHIRVGAGGHPYAGADRIRFLGVDLAFSANFAQKQDAEKIAARMDKFGIKIVHFDIMVRRRFPYDILRPDVDSTRELDPKALDRLNYFIAELKRNGIYLNLNLLNYRPFNAADGLPKEIEQIPLADVQVRQIRGFCMASALDLQKEYARKLLTHRNPYTGLTCAKDPAVAFVER